ncbi:TPA: restriction endonuclease subunit S [Enterococcus faecium]|uniref:restriction endonuclease subunit S n=1 Tax=Enterococcus faecalis TaxID=1351 RepID=UPI001927D825
MVRKKIEDLGKVISGGTPSTKNERYWGGDIAWITPKDLSKHDSMFIFKGERGITEEGLKNSSAYTVPTGTVLFSSRAPIGYVAIAGKNLTTNQGFKNIVVNDENDNLFIYYLLKNNIKFIESHANGSTFKEISAKVFKNLEFDVPNLDTQRKISKILSTLDSKIELNNQIISNLEELASTLFKRWFVDFEFPDENGKPYKSSGGKMVDSELGEIPEGWKVTNLEEISIDIITGKTPNTKQKENYGEDIPFIKIPDMHNNTYIVQTETYLSKKGSDSQYKKLLPKDSICVSCIATPGLVSITSVASHTNQQINTILPKVEDLYFLYLDLKRKKNLIRELGSGGSTTLNLNKTQFGKINIVNCGKREKMNFNKICEPLFSKILLLQKSNIYLAKLRDLLLPKLLSGEIELPEDEEM